jgi:hypothetical protein
MNPLEFDIRVPLRSIDDVFPHSSFLLVATVISRFGSLRLPREGPGRGRPGSARLLWLRQHPHILIILGRCSGITPTAVTELWKGVTVPVIQPKKREQVGLRRPQSLTYLHAHCAADDIVQWPRLRVAQLCLSLQQEGVQVQAKALCKWYVPQFLQNVQPPNRHLQQRQTVLSGTDDRGG